MRTRWLLGVGALLALLAAGVLLLVPLYSGETSGPDGDPVTTSATLLEVNGPGVLVAMLAPAVLAVGAWLAPWTWLRWALVGLLGAFCLLGLLTVGVFFLPALALQVLGAYRAQERERARPGPRQDAAWSTS